MPKPNQSANWDFKFNRKSPSQKKKEIYIYIYIYIKTRVSHKNSDSCMTNGGQLLKLKKMYHKKCYRYIHLHNNINRSDTNIVD